MDFWIKEINNGYIVALNWNECDWPNELKTETETSRFGCVVCDIALNHSKAMALPSQAVHSLKQLKTIAIEHSRRAVCHQLTAHTPLAVLENRQWVMTRITILMSKLMTQTRSSPVRQTRIGHVAVGLSITFHASRCHDVAANNWWLSKWNSQSSIWVCVMPGSVMQRSTVSVSGEPVLFDSPFLGAIWPVECPTWMAFGQVVHWPLDHCGIHRTDSYWSAGVWFPFRLVILAMAANPVATFCNENNNNRKLELSLRSTTAEHIRQWPAFEIRQWSIERSTQCVTHLLSIGKSCVWSWEMSSIGVQLVAKPLLPRSGSHY